MHLSTTRVFVRNLPFDATAEDLEQMCSDIGPVKRASIIQQVSPIVVLVSAVGPAPSLALCPSGSHPEHADKALFP